MKCSRCPAPAHFNFGGTSVLCVNCTLAMLEGCKIDSVASMDLAPCDVVPAASTAPSVPSGVAGNNSVSPGELMRSLPSGESEPSVTLACAPGESSFDPGPCGFDWIIPENIKRDADNIAPFVRGANA